MYRNVCRRVHRHAYRRMHTTTQCRPCYRHGHRHTYRRVYRPKRRRCIDMRIDMCINMCIDMCIDVCIDMCMDVCIDVCMAPELATVVRQHPSPILTLLRHKAPPPRRLPLLLMPGVLVPSLEKGRRRRRRREPSEPRRIGRRHELSASLGLLRSVGRLRGEIHGDERVLRAVYVVGVRHGVQPHLVAPLQRRKT